MTGTDTIPVADYNSSTNDSGLCHPGEDFLPWRRQLSKPEFAVLTALQVFADRDGYCWPSRKKLSELTGYHVTKISKITTRLVELGVLEKSGCGGRSSCDYRVLVPKYYAPEKLSPVPKGFDTGDTAHPKEQMAVKEAVKGVESGPGVTPAVIPGGHPEDAIELFKEQLQNLRGELLETRQQLQALQERQAVNLVPEARRPDRRQTGGHEQDIRSSFYSKYTNPEKQTQQTAVQTVAPDNRAPVPPPTDAPLLPTMTAAQVRPSAEKEETSPADTPEGLVFPPGIIPAFAMALLVLLPHPDLQQHVLDELAGQLQNGHIRNPYGYLKVLAERAAKGQFIPNAGIRIAQARLQRAAHQNRLQQAEAAMDKRLQEYQAQHPPALPGGRLGRSLERLRERLEKKQQSHSQSEKI